MMRKNSGFTLIEILILILVFVIVVKTLWRI